MQATKYLGRSQAVTSRVAALFCMAVLSGSSLAYTNENSSEEAARQEAAKAAERSAVIGRSHNSTSTFIHALRNAVDKAWVKPDDPRTDMSAIVTVELNETGNVVRLGIGKSSGNSDFDRSVLRAVIDASPFVEIRNLDPAARRGVAKFNLDFNPVEPTR